MRFPEFRVTRDGEAVFDITGMHVTQVESVIKLDGSIPEVKVTFAARIVEVEADAE